MSMNLYEVIGIVASFVIGVYGSHKKFKKDLELIVSKFDQIRKCIDSIDEFLDSLDEKSSKEDIQNGVKNIINNCRRLL